MGTKTAIAPGRAIGPSALDRTVNLPDCTNVMNLRQESYLDSYASFFVTKRECFSHNCFVVDATYLSCFSNMKNALAFLSLLLVLFIRPSKVSFICIERWEIYACRYFKQSQISSFIFYSRRRNYSNKLLRGSMSSITITAEPT
jgi:hypothetical protein